MSFKKVSTCIRKLADDFLSNKELSANVIFKKGNSFFIYGLFVLTPNAGYWEVITEKSNLIKFNTSSAALAWCILKKAGKSEIACKLLLTDIKIGVKQLDIDIHSFHLKGKDPYSDNSAMLQARLLEDIRNRQSLKKELSKCIDSAKYIQIKGTSK